MITAVVICEAIRGTLTEVYFLNLDILSFAVMEVASGEHGECVQKLVMAVNGGKCNNLNWNTSPAPNNNSQSPQVASPPEISDDIAKETQPNGSK